MYSSLVIFSNFFQWLRRDQQIEIKNNNKFEKFQVLDNSLKIIT